MEIDFEEILLSTTYNSKKNHIIASCPFCNKEDHFFFNVEKALEKRDGKYKNCWDCKKCTRKGNLVGLLRKLNRLNLLEGEYLGGNDFIKSPFNSLVTEDLNIEYTPKEIKIPIGFKRVYNNDYLTNERFFTNIEYEKYEVGYTDMYSKLKDYVIILLREKNRVRGYIARSRLNKKEINIINNRNKSLGLKIKYARYRNSVNSEFSKMLLGYEEIIFTTKWVILVEGFFDKIRVDQALKLDSIPDIKCCCTFGKEISEYQILKLVKKNIKGVILIQDPDAVDNSKQIGERLMNKFDKVLIGYSGDKDLGDSTNEEILNIIDNLKKPLIFRTDIVQKKL